MPTDRAGKRLGCPWQASVPLHRLLPPWWPASPRGSSPTAGRKLLYDLTSGVTHVGHFCNILSVTPVSPIQWAGTAYVCEYQEETITGTHMEAHQPAGLLSILQLSCVLVTVPGLGHAGVKEAGLTSVKHRKNSIHPGDLLGEQSFVGHTGMNKTTTF